MVAAFVSYLARLYGPLAGPSNIQVSIMTALVSFERVIEVLDLPPMIQERPNAATTPPGAARISFDGVGVRDSSAGAHFACDCAPALDDTEGRLILVVQEGRIVVQEGRIVERGTHTELLEQRGLHAELYRLQFAHPDELLHRGYRGGGASMRDFFSWKTHQDNKEFRIQHSVEATL